jgi:hypothetical protein
MAEQPAGHSDAEGASQASWGSFLKSIATFSGDLSSMTAPAFILSSTSLTEYSAYWAEHPSLLRDISNERDGEKRALLVLKWFIATLKGQYSRRNEKLGSEKKPFNPVLGELFIGKWSDESKDGQVGETKLVVEQVSHHPPFTAYHITNEQQGISLTGHNGQKSGFSGRTLTVRQIGHALLQLENHAEQYLITLPTLKLEGLIYGKPYVELSGHSYIQSSNGYLATIEYIGKGWVSGKKNSFKATLSKGGDVKHPLYTIEGTWTGTSVIQDNATKVEKPFWDASSNAPQPIEVKPVEEQGEWESRRLWATVAHALNSGNYELASKGKADLENSQRQKRKEEKASGIDWEQKYFTWDSKQPLVQALVKFFGILLM